MLAQRGGGGHDAHRTGRVGPKRGCCCAKRRRSEQRGREAPFSPQSDWMARGDAGPKSAGDEPKQNVRSEEKDRGHLTLARANPWMK